MSPSAVALPAGFPASLKPSVTVRNLINRAPFAAIGYPRPLRGRLINLKNG
jgi:hypothetical protein